MVFRRRLIFWLIKEYIRKWGKTFVFFFLIGLVAFFALWTIFTYYKPSLPKFKKESIGVVGAYTPATLPSFIMTDLARGLTKIDASGKVVPDIASSWEIKDDGKTYIFHLKKNLYFTNGKNLTSDLVNYKFTDASISRPDKYTIVYKLRYQYSPFLSSSVSKPIFINGYVGIGKYKLKKIDLNGTFVQSIDLVSVSNEYETRNYQFYPTEDAAKTYFMLGDVSQIRNMYTNMFRNLSMNTFPNVNVKKELNNDQLVTLFFNTKDSYLSDRDVRVGLTYALPDTFANGERTYTIYPKNFWTYSPQYTYTQDLEHAKQLTNSLRSASKSASIILSIKTLEKYKDTADIIQKNWEKIDIPSIVEVVDTPPDDFQIFLGDMKLPKDPDQYGYWHSARESNISRYDSKRIDKLLEDGRKTLDANARKKIYDDLQKYLLADAPAAFLYFPYQYTITRK